ncbi:MAG TPA: hypothetical protein VHV77_04725 [Pirellulales bacterium]|jgi:hypothetical protein|nr:hypothetical protein [Pirellulales bacterium]
MKRLVQIISVVCIVAAIVQVVRARRQVTNWGDEPTYVALNRTSLSTSDADGGAGVKSGNAGSIDDSAAFTALPIDKPQPITFELDANLRERLTRREQEDQLRDWLLFAVLGESRLSVDDLNRALYDVPAVRHGYLRPVGNFEYGVTRSCALGDGRVVAILPEGNDAQRKDHLATIVDDQRKNAGEIPSTVLVFEYRIDVDHLAGQVTRRADVSGAELFTPAYGYHSAQVSNLDEFRNWMEKIEDLTFAKRVGSAVEFGGRKYQSRSYRTLKVDDVAAVWQAQSELFHKNKEFEAKLQKEIDDFNTRWRAAASEAEAKWNRRAEEERLGLRTTPPAFQQPSWTQPNWSQWTQPAQPVNPSLQPSPTQDPTATMSWYAQQADPANRLRQFFNDTPTNTLGGAQSPDPLEAYRQAAGLPAVESVPDNSLGMGTMSGFGNNLGGFGTNPQFNNPPSTSGFDAFSNSTPGAGFGAFQPAAPPRELSIAEEREAFLAENKRDSEELDKKQIAMYREFGLPDHTGFSLDPTYDFPGLRDWFSRVMAGNAQADGDESARLDAFVRLTITADDAQKIQDGLNASDPNPVPLLAVMERLKKSDKVEEELAAEILRTKLNEYRYQAARYDGRLQGTEVGMVLFYTDLLAKLWTSVNLGDTLPRDDIPDFKTKTDGGMPAIYREATVRQPSTRLWFGPEDTSYQITDSRQQLIFARRATRIFAKSSNPLDPNEVPPTPSSEAVLGWWNDHYSEVAEYEPEFERLNEYMKWSLAISWLAAENAIESMSYLEKIAVSYAAWFPDWVKQNPQLRFNRWELFNFYERGYKSTKTEAMPILLSKNFANFGETDSDWYVEGGVSGGRPSTLKSRPALPTELPRSAKLALRGVKPESYATLGQGELVTARGAKVSFHSDGATRATLRVAPGDEAVMFSRTTEIVKEPVVRTVSTGQTQWSMSNRVGNAELGTFSSTRKPNGFVVGFRGRDVDLGQAVARRMSAAPEGPTLVAASDPSVRAIIRTPAGEHLLKVDGSQQWMRVVAEPKPGLSVPEGFQARVCDPKPGSSSYDLAWLDGNAAMDRALSQSEVVRIKVPEKLDQRLVIDADARGPPLPEGGRSFTLAAEGEPPLRGWIEPDGSIAFKTSELPPRYRQLDQLAAELETARTSGLSNKLKGAEPVALTASKTPSAGEASFTLGNRNDPLAMALACLKDPQAAKAAMSREFIDLRTQAVRYLDAGDAVAAKRAARELADRFPSMPEGHLLLAAADGRSSFKVAQDAVANLPPGRIDRQTLRRVYREVLPPEAPQAELAGRHALCRKLNFLDIQVHAAPGKTATVVETGVSNAGEVHVTLGSDATLMRVEPSAVTPGDRVFIDQSLGAVDYNPAVDTGRLVSHLGETGSQLYVLSNAPAGLRAVPIDSVVLSQSKSTGFAGVKARASHIAPSVSGPYVPSGVGDDDDDKLLELDDAKLPKVFIVAKGLAAP